MRDAISTSFSLQASVRTVFTSKRIDDPLCVVDGEDVSQVREAFRPRRRPAVGESPSKVLIRRWRAAFGSDVGDLNDYQFSPALSVLKTGTADGTDTPTLTDLITTLPTNQQYTYDFDGVSEVLDHILVSKAINRFTYQVVHVNAEFANQVSDHDPQVVDVSP